MQPKKILNIYKNVVLNTIEMFDAFDIKSIDKDNNSIVDVLSFMVSIFYALLT